MKKFLSTLLFTVVACTAYSQIVNFFGPTYSGIDETQHYSVTLFDEYPEYNQIIPIGGGNWYATGGTVISAGDDNADIQWTTAGLDWVEYTYETWDDFYYGIYYVTVAEPLTPPTAYAGTPLTSNTFSANWSSVPGITSYRLDISTVSDFSSFINNNLTVNGTDQGFVGSGVGGSTYYYRVRSYNGGSSSANSNVISVLTFPTAPQANFASFNTTTSFTANWASVGSATGYRLDVSTVSNFATFVSGYNDLTVGGTSQIVTGLVSGTTYYYRVRAVNGSGPSLNSNTITTFTFPDAPAASAATAISTISFTANWSSATSATSYRLDVSTINDFTSFISGYQDITVASTSQSVTGLTAGSTYYYRVRAVNSSATSTNSSTITTLTLPTVPTINGATSITTTSFTATWASVTSATSYRLDVSTVSNFASFVSGYNDLSVAGINQNVTGLSAGTIYYFRVRAVNGSGASASSSGLNTITLPVAPVANTASSVATTSFSAIWTSVASATSYRLDVSTVNNFASFVSGFNDLTVASTSQSVTGLTAGTTYYYRVRAVNGGGSSANSNTITMLTMPAAPVANAASSITTTSFTASWTSVSSATSYRLDVSTVNNFASFVSGFNDLTVASTSQSVTGLTAGTTYYYRVRAVNGSGTSANSNTITTLTMPAAPVANAASSVTTSSFTANWATVTGAASYRLDVSTVNSFASFVSGYNDQSVASTSQSVTGLTAGTTYYYRVRAVNASGPSSNSNTITALVLSNPPAAPLATNASNITSNSFTANWNSVGSATSYRLDVSTNSNFATLVSGFNDLTVSGTNQTVTPLTQKDATYYYRVRAVNGGGTSGNSNVITALNLDNNYVRITDILVKQITDQTAVDGAGLGQKIVTTNFFDGLGRPTQSVSKQQSPGQEDIVQPIVYDQIGREAVKYLPYTGGSDGWYKSNFLPKENPSYASASSPQYQFYQNTPKVAIDSKPYAETIFEPSPLNRVLEQGAPGVSWQPDATNTDRTIKMGYEFNGAAEVLLWTYTAPSVSSPNALGLVNAGFAASPIYYAANQLLKNRTKDEQYNEVIEYVDKLGRTVLKRVQVVPGTPSINDTNYASTYYIYDEFSNLVCVIPPEAVSRLALEYYHAAATNATKESFLKRWAFRYKYDNRKRMTQKQVPGVGQVYMVYDNRDRLVLTQDSVQRSGATNAIKYWTFTKYDELNRPILTGIKDTNSIVQLSQVQMQLVVDSYYDPAKTWHKNGETYVGNVANNVHGYTNTSYPKFTSPSVLDVNRYLTVTYYDNYNFRSLWVGSYNYFDENLTETVNGIPYNQPDAEFLRITGQVTGTKTKVLDGGITGGITWLKSVTYYDDNYHMIQTLRDNYKSGIDRMTNINDFTGKVLKSKTTHTESDVTWKDLVGVSYTGNILKRTTGTAGAASAQILNAGVNGWMEFTVFEINTTRYIGLNDSNPDALATNINYAFKLTNTTLTIVENNGSAKATVSNIVPGDVLRIERVGTLIKYFRNGSQITVTTGTASNTQLMVDVSTASANASFVGVRSSFSTTTDSVTRRFGYDPAGRLLSTWHRFNTQPEILLTMNEYNALGQLIDKKLHSTVAAATDAKQSVDYRYNIRGWLTKMNESDVSTSEPGDLFGMELLYDQQDANLANPQLFNGNISAIKWSNQLSLGTIKENAYTYGYDPLNRISSSTFKEKSGTWSTPANSAFAETGFTYDLNGNIKTLQRNDKRASGLMDNMTYDYGTGATTSNMLLKVTDTGDDFVGFLDGNPGTTTDYTYDGNGNMLTDLNKGISTAIAYNFLNLPELITRGTSNTVQYIYDASGRKLSQVASFNTAVKQTDYVGEYQYENDVLQFLSHEEGRIVLASTKTIFTHSCDVTTNITASTSTLAQVTQNGSTYVRATAVGNTAKQGMFPIGGTFPVLAGEQYRIRAKGYRTGAGVVHINIRVNGADLNWPGATLASSQTTEAWTEQTVTIPTGGTTMQAGVVWITTTAGQQFFLNDFEIVKINSNQSPEYQYKLRDVWGNTRLIFTTKVETITETATLETANASAEQSQFVRYAEARKIQSYLFDRTNGSSPTTNTGYSQRLSGSTNEKYGLGKSISVMPGDVISAEVYAKYVDPVSSNWTTALTTLMGYVANPGSAPAGTVVDGAGYSGSTATFPFPGAATQNTAGSSESGPKAYLNWLVFDRNFNFILSESGFDRISSTPKETGQDVAHEKLHMIDTIKQAGYVYFYLSNEETSPLEVYFDDFTVTQTKSPVIQTDDYYPFGLTYNSFKRENSIENKVKFQGQERANDLDLGWDSFKYRNFIPEIGRFFSVDPLGESYVYNSPYAFAENKLGRGVELEGLELGPLFFFARPVPVVRPVVETLIETSGSGKTTGQGLSNAARVGRLTHGEELPKWQSEGYQTEVKVGEGNRVDGIKIEQNQDGTSTGFVRELKPNTPSGRRAGMKQLDRYIDAASKENPGVNEWQPELTLYQLLTPITSPEGSNDNSGSTNTGNSSDQKKTDGLLKQVPVKSDATKVAPVIDPSQVKRPCVYPDCV